MIDEAKRKEDKNWKKYCKDLSQQNANISEMRKEMN